MRLAILITAAILTAAAVLAAASFAGGAAVWGIAWSKCAGLVLLGAGALLVRSGLALGRTPAP